MGMGRVIRALVFLMVLALIGLAGYAYFGNLAPEQRAVTLPVVLDAQ